MVNSFLRFEESNNILLIIIIWVIVLIIIMCQFIGIKIYLCCKKEPVAEPEIQPSAPPFDDVELQIERVEIAIPWLIH